MSKQYPSPLRLVSLSLALSSIEGNHRAGRTGGPSTGLRAGLTVADFPSTVLRAGFNAPSVDEVDVSGYKGAVGDPIVIRAHDDFDPSAVLRAGVMGVAVALTQADGGAIESGAAVALRPGSEPALNAVKGQATPANSGR